MRVERLVLLLGKERLVRVEGFDLQEPVIGLRVFAHELQPEIEHLRLRLVFFGGHVAPVDLVGYLRVPGYDGKDFAKIREALALIDERYAIEIPAIQKDVQLIGSEWRDYLPPGEEVIAYAASRGLSLETLEKFRIGQYGHYMTIPCFEEGVLKGIKMRNIWPSDLGKRFWSLSGSRLGLFNFDAVNLKVTSERTQEVTWIVKGEIPAMLMDQLGFHQVCAPTGGEGSGMRAVREWNTALALAAKIVIGDNDEAGKTLGWKRSVMFGASLWFPPKKYKDLDEWLLADMHDAIATLRYWKNKALEAWL